MIRRHIFTELEKFIPFKNAIEKENLGTGKSISPEFVESCKEFIRTVLYKGNSYETYLQTRVRLYDKQSTKSKTTMTIPPDIDSCTQHILRFHTLLHLTGLIVTKTRFHQ